MSTDFMKMIRYAAAAPSGHNTQPWKFRLDADSVTILPDPETTLPVVDPNNRELYISLGCATENLCIAASYWGYEGRPMGYNAERITVGLTRNPDMTGDPLFHQIEKRQTNRSIYDGRPIRREILNLLQSVRKEENIRFHLFSTGTPEAGTISNYIEKGNEIQMSDTAFKSELLSWMRFNRKQVNTLQDGLSYRVFGNPPLPARFARPIVSLFLKPDIQNRTDRKKIRSSSHFVVFTTRHHSVVEWIGLGQTLQRFLLTATGAGIACAFMNQPCEIPAMAAALQKDLPIPAGHPAVILRIGYAGTLPYAPRKDIRARIV